MNSRISHSIPEISVGSFHLTVVFFASVQQSLALGYARGRGRGRRAKLRRRGDYSLGDGERDGVSWSWHDSARTRVELEWQDGPSPTLVEPSAYLLLGGDSMGDNKSYYRSRLGACR